jgi:hypothetical protein
MTEPPLGETLNKWLRGRIAAKRGVGFGGRYCGLNIGFADVSLRRNFVLASPKLRFRSLAYLLDMSSVAALRAPCASSRSPIFSAFP